MDFGSQFPESLSLPMLGKGRQHERGAGCSHLIHTQDTEMENRKWALSIKPQSPPPGRDFPQQGSIPKGSISLSKNSATYWRLRVLVSFLIQTSIPPFELVTLASHDYCRAHCVLHRNCRSRRGWLKEGALSRVPVYCSSKKRMTPPPPHPLDLHHM